MRLGILLTICFAASSVRALDVAVTGTVTDAGGSPVAGAAVRLQRLGLSDETAGDGGFSIVAYALGTRSSRGPVRHMPFVRGAELCLPASVSGREISLEVFDSRGRLVHRAVSPAAERGRLRLPLFASPGVSTGLYLVRLTVDGRPHLFRHMLTRREAVRFLDDIGEKLDRSLGKQQAAVAVDTVVVTAAGYATKKVGIGSYSENLTIVLDAAPSGAAIEFADIYLAFDTAGIDTPRGPFETNCLALPAANLGDTLYLNILLRNSGMSNALSVLCSLSTDDQYVSVIEPVAGYNNVGRQATALNYTWYKIVVDRSVPAAYSADLALHIRDSWGGRWEDRCFYLINPFVVDTYVVDDDDVPDSYGNANGRLDEGEIVEFTPRLLNRSSLTIGQVSGLLYSPHTGAQVRQSDDMWPYGDFGPADALLPEWDYVLEVLDTVWQGSLRFDLLIFGQVEGVERRWLLPVDVVAAAPAPGRPSGLTAVALTDTSVVLRWTAVQGAESYTVYRAPASSGIYEIVGQTDTILLVVGGLECGTMHYFRVRAANASGEGDFSSYVSTTTGPCVPPTPASIQAVALSDSSIRVSWSSSGSGTMYRVFRSITETGTYDTLEVTTSSSVDDEGLVCNTTYYYKVLACNVTGASAPTPPTSAATMACPTVPLAPLGLSAAGSSSSSASLSWTPVANATLYKIYRSSSAAGTYDSVGTSTTASHTDMGLQPGTTYYYKVKACNVAGDSPLSQYAAATTSTWVPGVSPNIEDYVLMAYRLSAAQSASFDAFDGAISPFWALWDTYNSPVVQLDYVHMASNDPAHAWDRSTLGFDGTADDARITIRAAYDNNGAYFYYEVTDNDWVPVADWGNDVVSTYIDNLSSLEIWAMDPLFAFAVPWASLTFTHRQIDVPFGSTQPPTGFEFNSYDDLTWTILDDNFVPFADAPTLYDGLAIEVVTIDATRKAQEWFIPWSVYGVGGILGGTPATGAMFALVLGYNDSDSDQPGMTDGLRWKNLCDPWCGQTVDTYGDLEVSGVPLP